MTTAEESRITINHVKFQTCQQPKLYLQDNRKVHAITAKPSL